MKQKNRQGKAALESLRMMNLRDPEELMKKKPYELSGGMCQRVNDRHCHVHVNRII